MLRRNAAIALGNQRDAAAIPALQRGLGDLDAVVRGACVWALGQIGTPLVREILQRMLRSEADPGVALEIQAALAQPANSETLGEQG